MTELQKMQALAGVFAILWVIAIWCYIGVRIDLKHANHRIDVWKETAEERRLEMWKNRHEADEHAEHITDLRKQIEDMQKEQWSSEGESNRLEQSRIQALEHFSKAAVEIAEAALLLMDGGPDHAFAESMRESLDKIKAGDPVSAAEALAKSDKKYPPRPDTKSHAPVFHPYRS